MKKEISYSQFQQVKSAAKMIDPNMRKIEALKKKIMPLVEEMKQYQALNDSLEAGIVSVIGYHVSDLVKKVIGDIIEFGSVKRALLGVLMQEIDSKKDSLRVPAGHLYVSWTGSPAG